MNSEIKAKEPISIPKKKVRIGSPVPAENREWLKHHGIVTDISLPKISERYASSPKKPQFNKKRLGLVLTLVLFSILPSVWFQQRQELLSEIEAEQSRLKSMENSNYHLRGSFAALSSVNLIQQSEINRLAKQIQGMTGQFNSQVGGFQKGEAMYDALHHTYDNELARISRQYDVEVEALQKQVHDKEQMISSLESSLDSMDGVVVRADSIANPGVVNSALVASVNVDFQFIIIDAGDLKGVKLGQMIEINHAGAVIGYGQIEKIYPDFSGARVFSDDAITRVKKGDSVFLQRLPAF